MSVRDSFTPSNGFNGNVGFEANFDDLNRALDSPYSPGILETEMISNRSSVISDILNLNDKSYDLNTNTDSIKHFINKNDGLNSNNNQNFRSYQDNLSDNQNEDYLKKNTKSGDSSTLEAAALVDVNGSSLDDDADWLFSKKANHAISSNAINCLNGDKDDVKKTDTKPNNNNNSSAMKRYSSGKIERFSDFGQVTQIIGVPPLSASNKDLSSIGKELSLNKQQDFENVGFEAIDHQTTLTVSNSKLNFGSGYVLADFSDVQNAAKLQEQSLRMSFSTPLVNGNKGLSLKSSNKKLNEAGAGNKLQVKTNPASRTDTSRTRATSSRSPARNNVPLSQYNSNGMINKKLNDKSCKVEPFQKSLPNLTRKLQPARGQTAGRVQRAMLPQAGPPVRTASQPTVNSQLKGFQRSQPQRTTSTVLKPQGMSLNQRNLNPVKKTSTRAPPTSLNTSSRVPNASRQPLSTRQPPTNSRQPLTNTFRQPLSNTTRQPLSNTSRQPLSNTSRQPLSNTTRQPLLTRQPLNTSRQLQSTTSRQAYSTTTRQPLAATNRAPLNNTGRLTNNTASRTTAATSRLASGTRTPLSNPPTSNRNAPQARSNLNASSTMSRNAPSYLNKTNQSTSSNRTNLSAAPNRNNIATNRSNTSMTRGTVNNPRTNPTTRGNLSTVNKPKSNLNTLNTRAPPSSSNPLRNPTSNTNRASTLNKPTLTRSTTPRNPLNSALSKTRPHKPSPLPSHPSSRGGDEDEGEDWKYGCF